MFAAITLPAGVRLSQVGTTALGGWAAVIGYAM
jgi:hypothetical protein